MVRPLAKTYGEYLSFATVDTREYPHMAAMFGLRGKGLCLQALHNGQIYHHPPGEVSTASVQQFIVAVSEGKAAAWDKEVTSEDRDEL